MGTFPAWLLLLALLGVSLGLIFAGRTLVKVIAFLLVGFAGASAGGVLAAHFLTPAWDFVGILLGFVVGGLLGVALVSIGIGLALGYAGYLLALDLAFGVTIALVAGVIFFIVGLVLSGKILSVATAVAGGLLLFSLLTSYTHLGPMPALLLSGLAVFAGLWVQLSEDRRATQSTPVDSGGRVDQRQ